MCVEWKVIAKTTVGVSDREVFRRRKIPNNWDFKAKQKKKKKQIFVDITFRNI